MKLNPGISVIIPAYNEERYLPRLLADVAEARRRYRGSGDIEVIVADNGSTDATPVLAAQFGAQVVTVVPRQIGAVRNAGARVARGRVLAFVDADTRIHPETFNAIHAFFADDAHVVGATGILPERRSLGIDVTWVVLAVFTALLGYGVPRKRSESAPTGLVCCRRTDWAAVGGYSERLLFAEDVQFLRALKRLGRTRGQAVGWLEDVPATFSARKFDVHGDWHMVFLPLRFALGILWLPSLRSFAERYWYGAQRQPSPDEVVDVRVD